MDKGQSRKRIASSENVCNSGAGRTTRRAMHPSNKYAEKPPDFNYLASVYPSFSNYVSYTSNKKPRIDWTDFNATRELTRVLLEHDFGIKWWVPDGQLCPTVPNRLNYIHWIDDLISVSPAPWHSESLSQIRGVDIGTGANCIYPLLGAALHGWHFVGTDITPVALDWAKRNVEQNPQYAEQIEIRKAAPDFRDGVEAKVCAEEDYGATSGFVTATPETANDQIPELKQSTSGEEEHLDPIHSPGLGGAPNSCERVEEVETPTSQQNIEIASGVIAPSARSGDPHDGSLVPPVLWGVVKEGERFDFCMCNPPFFESMEDAGLNPRTACGGSPHEMVCPGGELSFITQIIEDSVRLGTTIQWYTSMVGRKVNLKALTSRLRAIGVTTLRTTEFVQGQTSRWGIAWSFSPVPKATVVPGRAFGRNKVSFMLEGINRQFSSMDVLQEFAKQLRACGATTAVDIHSFSLNGTLSKETRGSQDQFDVPCPPKMEVGERKVGPDGAVDTSKSGSSLLSFQASVFQQVPGTLLIKASLLKGEGPSGAFSSLFEQVELSLKNHFEKPGRR